MKLYDTISAMIRCFLAGGLTVLTVFDLTAGSHRMDVYAFINAPLIAWLLVTAYKRVGIKS